MEFNIPYVGLVLTVMILAITVILQTMHYANRISGLEEKIAELTRQLGQRPTV